MAHTAHAHWLVHLYAAVRAKGCLNDTQSDALKIHVKMRSPSHF